MTLSARRHFAHWCAVIAAGMALAVSLRAETGYDLWLRYAPLTEPGQRAAYRRSATAIVVRDGSPTSEAIAAELGRGLRGLLGVDVPRVDRPQSDGAVIVGTPSTSPLVAALGWTDALARARRRGLRHSLGESRRPCRDGDRVEGRSRRAIRRVPFSSPDPDAPADGASRHRRAPPARAAAAESLGQSRRQHRARLCRAVALVARPRRPAPAWTTRARTPRSGSTAPSSTASTRTRSR